MSFFIRNIRGGWPRIPYSVMLSPQRKGYIIGGLEVIAFAFFVMVAKRVGIICFFSVASVDAFGEK
jgi:hypothetical protein